MINEITKRKTGKSFQTIDKQPYLKPSNERETSFNINHNVVKTAAQGMTTIAYGDSGDKKLPVRCLNFKVECDDYKDFAECIKIIDSYNEFDSDRILKATRWNLNLQHYLNDNNPNNGKSLFRFQVAREGSPAFYVSWNEYFEGKIIKDTEEVAATETTPAGTTLFWEEYTAEDFKTNMENLSSSIGADEFDIDETIGYGDRRYFTARFWFD